MRPTLYLMLGLPGAGKTTAALEIARQTGAVHLWADKVRREKFGHPTYSHQENQKLYQAMNSQAEQLLADGKSVVFDTNFKFYKDRQHLTAIARQRKARVLICWLKVAHVTAKWRALNEFDHPHRPVGNDMTEADFERLSSDFELPRPHETVIELDGTKITPAYVTRKLQLDEAA